MRSFWLIFLIAELVEFFLLLILENLSLLPYFIPLTFAIVYIICVISSFIKIVLGGVSYA